MGRKKGTILSFVVIALEIFSTLFLTPFIIRTFGKSEYGVYTLIISITSYLALLDLGIGNSVVKFVSQYRVNNDEVGMRKFEGIINTYYLTISFISLIIGLILIFVFPSVFVNGLSEQEIYLGQNLLFITTLNCAITLGTAGFYYTIIGYEKFGISKGISIIFTLIRIVLSFVALKCGGTSLAIVTINALITFFTRMIMVVYVFVVLKIRPTLKQVTIQDVKKIVFFSFFVFLQMLATQINSMADNILIGIIVNDASVILAIYGVGASIKQYLSTFGGAINGVLMPGVVKLVESDSQTEKIENEMIRIGRIVFALVGFIFVGFVVCGQMFIEIWAGDGYDDAYFVAILLMIPYLFTLSQSIGTQVLWAKNQHKEMSILKIVIVLLNIILTILLMKFNNLYGAVLGTFISMMLGDVVVMQIVFKKKLNLSLKKYYKNTLKGIFPSMIISLIIGILVRLLQIKGWFGLVIVAFSMIVVYIVMLFIIGLNESEKKYIKRFLKND